MTDIKISVWESSELHGGRKIHRVGASIEVSACQPGFQESRQVLKANINDMVNRDRLIRLLQALVGEFVPQPPS